MAHEAGVDFTMQDIDRLSRRVPVLCKVAPNSHYHIQDVNRAGGIFAILRGLDRAGLLDTSVLRVDGRTLGEAIPACDILNPAAADAARRRALSAPAGHYSRELGAQHSYYEEPDTDRTAGCIRDVEHAYFRDGGLAVLTGNIALGFWTDIGNADPATLELLKSLKNKKIFLFGTAGFGGSEAYFQQVLGKVKESVDESNTVMGEFMCQGKMPQSVRDRYVKMKEKPDHAPNLDELIQNFDRALSHPDNEDLDRLEEIIRRDLEK